MAGVQAQIRLWTVETLCRKVLWWCWAWQRWSFIFVQLHSDISWLCLSKYIHFQRENHANWLWALTQLSHLYYIHHWFKFVYYSFSWYWIRLFFVPKVFRQARMPAFMPCPVGLSLSAMKVNLWWFSSQWNTSRKSTAEVAM